MQTKLATPGFNNVEEPIMDMLSMGADKTLDNGRDNLIGPYYPTNWWIKF